MKKVTNIFEDKYGGAVIVREDGRAERLTRAEFKERAEEFKDVAGVSGMLGQWIHEEENAREERESFERCKRIADELEDLASGAGRKCPHCGEAVDPNEVKASEHEDEEGNTVYTCPACGRALDDLDEYTLCDYFYDCYDVEYRCDASGEYRSVSVMIACGGPNIYIDTALGAVCLYWWGNTAQYNIDSDTVAAIDEIFEEYFNSLH